MVHLFAYPEAVVPATLANEITTECVDAQNGAHIECSVVGVVNGTWLLVRAIGPADQISAVGVQTLYDRAASRVQEHPRGAPATRTAQWWAEPDCTMLADRIDPAIYGFESVTLLEPAQTMV